MNKNLFDDEALRQVILEHLNSMHLELSDENFLKITELYGVNRGIKNLHGIELLRNLKKISLWDNQISDIKPLAQLEKLEEIYMDSNCIENIDSLQKLENLRILYMADNHISDIRGLRKLKRLTEISLWSNKIADISPLFCLDKLSVLDVEDNPLIGEASAENFKSAKGIKITK